MYDKDKIRRIAKEIGIMYKRAEEKREKACNCKDCFNKRKQTN